MDPKNKNTIHVSEDVEDAFLQGEQVIDPLRPDKNSEESDDDQSEKSSIIKPLIKWTAWIAGFAVFVFVLFNFAVKTYLVDGLSMFPTFNDGDRVVLSLTGKTWANMTGQDYIPKRGEVIVLLEPEFQQEQYIKRVVGLPGERVVLKDYQFTIYNETYPTGFNPDPSFNATLRPTDGDVDITVPDGHVFVVGDNREKGGSYDSRSGLGTVSNHLIQGRVWIRFLPVSEFQMY